MEISSNNDSLFIPLEHTGFTLPSQFTYPFNYTPHPLTIKAAEELQQRLTEENLGYHYGLEGNKGYGKMFGVLVVKNEAGELGYLAAFSGKMGDKSLVKGFVPPVYDRLTDDGFFLPQEHVISELNEKIKQLEQAEKYTTLTQTLDELKKQAERTLATSKQHQKEAKKARDKQRVEGINTLNPEEYHQLNQRLENESKHLDFEHKKLKKHWNTRLIEAENALNLYKEKLKTLKEKRKTLSAQLQQQLFDQYQLLNIQLEPRGLCSIFNDFTGTLPPAGAGDCAAPKLLQYAFKNGYSPICMGEFWWGASPVQEVRKHGHFYPACRGKCEPILSHMLKGMSLEPNPSVVKPTTTEDIDIIFEDEFLLVINKPDKLLSVPGKTRKDSVYERIKRQFPSATGPLLVHRLDMATSGLLLIAKNEAIYKALQAQFITRKVQKRYIAILDGLLKKKHGNISLPLRVDLDNRPNQLVCYKHGKPAETSYEVIQESNGKSHVYFYPLTGRTHQLRVHAAHQHGLNTAIIGDDLYGTAADRLYLHAEQLSFEHPVSGKQMNFNVSPPWVIS